MKYLAVYTKQTQEYTPPNDYHDNGKGSYHTVEQHCYKLLEDKKELVDFIQYKTQGCSNLKYFELGKQIYPKLVLDVSLVMNDPPPTEDVK